jgi:hypothetical protein
MLCETKTVEQVLFEAVDESLMILGQSARASIYLHLESKYSIRKDEIPQKLEIFSQMIRGLLGQEGKSIIDGIILKKFCQKLNAPYETIKDLELESAIEEMKRRQLCRERF